MPDDICIAKINKFDILHAHYGLSGIITLLAKSNEKLVVSFMGSDLLCSSVHKNFRVNAFFLIGFQLNLYLAKKCDYVIFKSSEMALKIGLYNRNSIIPNGVDLTTFYPMDKEAALSKLEIAKNASRILFIFNPERIEKNFQLAKRALEIVDDSVELNIISDVDAYTLRYYYNAADVMILTSLYEGSPNVIKEAMACNCPVVSTDVGDVKWVLGNTEGSNIASFDPDDFAEKIRLSLEFAKTQGRTNGRNRIMELGLDTESVAKRIITIYNSVLTRNVNY